MEISVKEFIKKLRMAMFGVEQDSVFIDGADAFIFRSGKLYSYNDSVMVSIPCDMGGLEFAVSAKEFLNFLVKSKAETVKIDIFEHNIRVTAGRSTIQMTNIPENITPRVESLMQREFSWGALPAEFTANLKTTLLRCAFLKQDDRAKFQGLYLKGDMAMSTDSIQVNTLMYDSAFFAEHAVWIGDKTVDILSNFDMIDSVDVTEENRVFFKGGDVIVGVKKYVDTYPCQRVLDTAKAYKPVGGPLVFSAEAFDALSRAVAFAGNEEGEAPVTLVLSPEKDSTNITLKVLRASGSFEETITVAGESPHGSYSFDGRRLLRLNKIFDIINLTFALRVEQDSIRCALLCTNGPFTAFIVGK